MNISVKLATFTMLLFVSATMVSCTQQKLVTLNENAAPAAESAQAGPMPGNWSFEGNGNDGRAWAGVLEINKLEDGSYTGVIVGSAEGYSGRERFTGSFNGRTKVLTFTSVVISGNIQPATYTCKVSMDGRSLIDGKWTGTSDSPGRWTARLSE